MDDSNPTLANSARRPSLALSVLLFVVAVGLMAYLRLHVFRYDVITLTYGLPLLLCLWHRDRRLLWAMTLTFCAMATYKAAFVLEPAGRLPEAGEVQVAMQLVNTLVIAGVIHLVLNLFDRLKAKQAALEAANRSLLERQEEIARQNEELQTQSEELAQQNEEIQQQAEEVQQQSEELQAQAEELQQVNSVLVRREAMMQALLNAMHLSVTADELPRRICESLQLLFGPAAAGVAVVERVEDRLRVLAYQGDEALPEPEWPLERTFAQIVLNENRTAAIEDLALRPDLVVPAAPERIFRSVLATPLRLNDRPAGVIKVFSAQPRRWAADEFRIIEWASAQCTLVMECQRLRAELERHNRELDELVARRTTELQNTVNDLEHFSYTITHDLRAPLRAMHGFAAMLEADCREQLSPESQDYLRRITTAAARMDRLITDALSYSGAVRQEFTLEPIEPARLLRGMIESYPMFQAPAAEIVIEGELPRVLGNEAALTQCFSNLLGNAVKFVAPGTVPHVRIAGVRDNGRVRLMFHDNGIGIPEASRSRLFAMFQRLNKSYEGTGIGLALVKKVAERMGGRVGVNSRNGSGSCFWLELPGA